MTQLGDVCNFKEWKLAEVCDRLSSGKVIRSSELTGNGAYPVIGGNGERGRTETYNFDGECAVVGRQGANCGNTRFFKGKAYMTEHAVVVQGNEKVNTRYLAALLSTMHLGQLSAQSAQPGLSVKTLAKQTVALPPREVQDRIAILLTTIDDSIYNINQTNGYLLEMMDARCKSVFGNERDCALNAVCSYVGDKTSALNAESSTYVSTESLIASKGGRQLAASLPKSGKATVYKAGDTLVSNIRPYFKKIWFADMDGTCSTDVLVFRAKNPSYKSLLFFTLYNDDFFAHLVAGSKGTKMPRGDKNQAMHYGIPTFDESLKQLASQANHVLALVSSNSHQAKALAELRDALLPKLMSGEIDVSKVELPTQANSHLCG
ncbi:hypothetical protein EMO89_05875 [Bifidobacterium tissieri]|uniref:Type I restriction modification DNA specificity domain-containing protein n=1 Tax=Bifidobacterium tissieri TaxID=1630162 RepID=A0A5M9ZT74_9BIFI|nr:restriction endonuclease subunit S [Bifidobacterium tissieri]KAA8830503.1 hypothetical protein EMO89_05875 [Bifidobacterium tissieri]